MATEIRVPTLGESVTEATVAQWFKKPGDSVSADEPLVELETDKVTVEVPAPAAGVLSEIIAKDGETVEVGALLGEIGEGKGAAPAPKKEEPKKAESKPETKKDESKKAEAKEPAKPADATPSPAVRRVAEENDLDVSKVEGTGKGGRVTKADAEQAASSGKSEAKPSQPAQVKAPEAPDQSAREERVKMTRLRKTIATRLKEAQNTAAMLTTFNEVDLTNVMALRSQYKDLFEKKHGVRVGFMGFFVKACIHALREIPAVNAEIDGEELVYKNYYNIGVAVGTDRGLVVPVLRDAQDMSLADVEKSINDFGKRARDGALKLEDLQGGTFTISNGGVYGSLMSTPILNAPQSGILGMHKIQERPMVVDGKIEIRPMMYLALSYDHRIVDGKEAVTFLVRVKESLEDPQRLLLDL
ncbi:MAG: 2-oxoglutarate dehydrogenase complex dihydrolipoyllysine-residue succinyltransferase [Parvibaculum sp.]|uniref:2-oxoglutarate dehydrogenase complex dihydrolipoyllysine-residue succinyltransferase n=1 Tax=Parvibaculum sp. TaxID=2024848 RepID=UPI001B226A91|nr:2-oxoglutarate dehydrogenase complex dihydrolipoyllysine-residue succinyltransferase [Parvibaculum sp.]MBO6633352.1 2-oxoglutarate dehydrogenase complex dihydrolipoyllysine-residue succinyltransferase [Parvibaculum sp.]